VHSTRRLLVIVCFLLFATAFASADQITANFTINPAMQTVASQGSITLLLTLYGVIDASVTITNGYNILGFGLASPQTNLLLTSFMPTQPDVIEQSQDAFGTQNTGFSCACGTMEIWTIGTQGQFTSVLQILGGKSSTVDFVLVDSFGLEWGADAVGSSPVPEPSSLVLLAVGALAGLGSLKRRIGSRNR
jgi:PEP-CTERM motif